MLNKIASAFGPLDTSDPNVQQAQKETQAFFNNPRGDSSPQLGIGNTPTANLAGNPNMGPQSQNPAPFTPQQTKDARVVGQNVRQEELPQSNSVIGNLSPIPPVEAAVNTPEAKEEAHKVNMASALWQGYSDGVASYTDTLLKPIARATGLMTDEDIKESDLANKQAADQAKKDHPFAYIAGNIGADLTAYGAAMNTAGAAIKGTTGLASIGKNVLSGAALGALQTPDEGESRVGNAAMNAALFGGVDAAGQAIIKGGKFLLGIDTNKVKQAADLGLDLSPTQASTRPFISKAVKNIVDSIPMSGSESLKSKQATQIEGAIKNFADQVAEGSKGSPEVLAGMVKNRYKQVYDNVDTLFKRVGVMAEKSGANSIDMSETSSIVSNLLKNSETKTSGEVLISQHPDLMKLVNNPTLNYSQASQLRTLLGRENSRLSRAYNSGNTDISLTDLKTAKDLYASVSNSIDNWAATSAPEVGKAYAKAVGYFKAANKTFEDVPQLMNAIEGRASLQKFVGSMLNDGTPETLTRNLSYVKRDMGAVRSNLIQEALNKSMSKENPNLPVNITKFINELKKPGDRGVSQIWGTKLNQLQGLEKILYSVEKDLKTGSMSPTMKQFILTSSIGSVGVMAGMQGAADPSTLIGASIGAIALSRIMTNPKTAKLLAQWHRTSDSMPAGLRQNLMKATLENFKDVLTAKNNKSKFLAYQIANRHPAHEDEGEK